ncbi:MAG: hypothetical protein IPN42_09775 [Methylococcaceae bacterium]|nr:hypothetical protein [Methylococcaceae bacterium]
MPCRHKFITDLHLEQLDFEPATLIVGTFNPDWDILSNYAQWFYGRTRNNYFWDVLPRLYGEQPLRQASPSEWKAFCRRHRIALTDLIASIDDADSNNADHIESLKNYRDDLIARQFDEFSFVDILDILVKHNSIEQVYLTRSVNDAFWRQRWDAILTYCQTHEITCKTLLTPSGGARFRMPKGVNMSLGDFIFEQWQNNWHFH